MKNFLRSPWTWILLLPALLPRLVGLDQFITSDENTNIFHAGSDVLLALWTGNLRGTYWHFYPGVTMSWADALGLAGQWLGLRLRGGPTPPFTEFITGDIRTLLVAARLPYALLTALFVPIIYHLLRRWLDRPGMPPGGHHLALLAALLIAFDPFFLAHSRVVHGDAPVSVFMLISVLALLLYLRQYGRTRYGGRGLFLLSAVTGSMAALTKAPGQLMAPLVIIFLAGDWLLVSLRQRRPDWRLAQRRMTEAVLWGGLALLVMIALWPAMWVAPIDTVRQMLAETFGKVNEGHLVFFMGQPTLDPGPWFYLYVIPFRLTPLTSIGLGLSLGMLGWGGLVSRRGDARVESDGLVVLTRVLWIFALLLLLSGNLSPKKQDRYLLPIFPVIDLLAAIGWVGLGRLIIDWGNWGNRGRRLGMAGVIALATIQLAYALPHHPYYLTYFNPLMGGLSRAVETTLVGWGEGLEQAAAYLNQKPAAESLYVASTPAQTLLPYFKGQGDNFYTNDVALRADYVVIYRAQQQRLAPSPEIVNYFLQQPPEHVIELGGVPYAWIYRNTPLIHPDVPDWGTLVNFGFGDLIRLAGYHLEPDGPTWQVDLFWHALPLLAQDVGPCREVQVEHLQTTLCPRIDYAVSLRLLNAAGEPVAQHDDWPAGGLLPTSQWQVDDYVQDRHILTLPADLPPGEYQLAVVVYNAETQAVLAGPISFATQDIR